VSTPPTTWGPWTFDRERLVLDLTVNGEELYDVDLERCPTAEAVLDWIAQVQGKAWATPEVTGQLVAALCDLLSPQTRLCPGGMGRRCDPAEDISQVLRENEIKALAWRLANPRLTALAASRGFLGGYSALELLDARDQAVREVREQIEDPQ
jgi:hypothetical protein